MFQGVQLPKTNGSWHVSGPTPDTGVSLEQVPFLQQFHGHIDELQRSAPSAADLERFPHLNQSVMVSSKPRGKKKPVVQQRRMARIDSPTDLAALVKEAQDTAPHKYVKLENDRGSVGRIQSSPFASGTREQHYYDKDSQFVPYPDVGASLSSVAKEPGMSTKKVYQNLNAQNRGESTSMDWEPHKQEFSSVLLVFNISEPQRSGLMAASTNLRLDNVADMEGDPPAFSQLFGNSKMVKGERKNIRSLRRRHLDR